MGRKKPYDRTRRRKHSCESRGGEGDPFFVTVYVDDYFLAELQHSDVDSSALITSASLASVHVQLFGPGETGATPILAPKVSPDWDSKI